MKIAICCWAMFIIGSALPIRAQTTTASTLPSISAEKAGVRITATIAEVNKLSDSVTITFSVLNESDVKIRYYTAAHFWDFQVTLLDDATGKEVPRTEAGLRHVRARSIIQRQMKIIDSGEKRESTYDVRELFILTKPGKYRLNAQIRLAEYGSTDEEGFDIRLEGITFQMVDEAN